MKNPNGYGSVVKLSGRRRRPFAARITAGWTEDGRQIKRAIGYYATRREALTALANYNMDPTLFSEATFADVYAGWHADKFYGDYSLEQERNFSRPYSRCSGWHDRVFSSIKLMDIQAACDELPNYEQAYRLKILVHQMSEWAIARDLASRDYAKDVVIKQTRTVTKPRDRFTREEIERVASDGSRVSAIVLILIYTGCRISELLDLRREDVDMERLTLSIGKSKTDAGVRVIPLHERIVPIVRTFFDEGRPWLVTSVTGKHFTYNNWQTVYAEFQKNLNIDHTTHETRHTFISLLAEAKVDQTHIKKLCGHKSTQSLTEAVYTHLTIEDLRAELNKIP